jgi:probable F420-dependent oxidoreductase
VQVVAGMSDRLPLGDTGAYARRVERLGYDVLHVPETVHDSMAVALLALEHTTTLRVQTSVTLAFPRSPMLVAYQAWDLQQLGDGRFALGLGPQIRQNIVERYSVPWAEPVSRLREYVEALRAIWRSFATGEPLRYEGEHYRFTRLQPFFRPEPLTHPAPEIWLGGVNEGMTRLGGSHADGFVTHPTNSHPRFLRERCRPWLAEGEASAGRAPGTVQLVSGSTLITGPDRAALDASRERHRAVLAFLYSTPAYRRTLELHGWSELGARLQQMTRTGAWDQLPTLVTDEVLDTLVPQGTWDDLPDVVRRWFGGLVDGVIVPVPEDPVADGRYAEVLAAIRSATV